MYVTLISLRLSARPQKPERREAQATQMNKKQDPQHTELRILLIEKDPSLSQNHAFQAIYFVKRVQYTLAVSIQMLSSFDRKTDPGHIERLSPARSLHYGLIWQLSSSSILYHTKANASIAFLNFLKKIFSVYSPMSLIRSHNRSRGFCSIKDQRTYWG